MKLTKSFLAAVFFTSVLGGAVTKAKADDGIVSKDELATGSYCRETFPAMITQSLATDQPILNQSGAIIDFYGPCDENPVGQDQVQEQKLEAQHRFQHDYED